MEIGSLCDMLSPPWYPDFQAEIECLLQAPRAAGILGMSVFREGSLLALSWPH